ncbi:MAG TPA: outer membrane beta-barrel protein [Bryobacteraceae bacterium]|nr:outer membrane beta-barrel protein [Bryobacteraceae bacterium]
MFQTSRPVSFRWRGTLIAVAAALAAAVPVFPQNQPPASAPLSGEYSIFDISPFAGYQWFQIYAKNDHRVSEFEPGLVVGLRVTEDLSKYIGLEQSFTAGFNDLRLRPFGIDQQVGATARNYTIAINPVFHFTPRQSKFRPFVTVGPGLTWYDPGKNVNTGSVAGAIPPTDELKTKYGPSMIYGGGIKYNASRRVGLRVDVRGTWSKGVYFGLPSIPGATGSIYSPHHGSEHAMAVTGGIVFRFGHRTDEAPAPPPPPPPAPKPAAEITVGPITGARDVCPGESVRLEVTASGWLPEQTPAYQWMVNGQPVSGATGASFDLPTADSPGDKTVTVRVSAGETSKTSEPVTVRVKEYSAPTVQFAVTPSTIPFGEKVPLNATAKASECGGQTTVTYSASEGTVSGNTFDAGTVAFDPANRLKQQTKVIKLTATATDQKGGTSSAVSDVTVTLSPEARRLDDIVFPANSARVNNCAKRLLLEQLTPMLREDPNATVILIGHRDEREKGRAAARLDRARALNAAAVLSAGTGICPQLELSRVKVGSVGSDQSSPVKPLLCGASTDVKERSGQTVRSSDQRAQFRRVEVWIVPGGAAMPAGVTGVQDAPASEVQKLGCPK